MADIISLLFSPYLFEIEKNQNEVCSKHQVYHEIPKYHMSDEIAKHHFSDEITNEKIVKSLANAVHKVGKIYIKFKFN